MSRRTEAVIGVDLGTTSAKALLRGIDGDLDVLVTDPTPWTTLPGGGTQTTAADLLDLTHRLIDRAVREAEERRGPVQVLGLGVTGLAESGVLLDPAGQPCAPVIAWFDRRGTDQVAAVDRRTGLMREEFSRRTGLPWDCQASIAKLLWLRDDGIALTDGHRWASVPEWVVHRLGGTLVREPSLASRTGLVDQATGEVWVEGLTAVGLPTTLLPPVCRGGQRAGTLTDRDLSPAVRGAALTVAGHDHPVAAIGVGATGPDELFNSTGTADVVARSLPGPLDDDRRERLVAAGLSAGSHVLEGTTLVLGGARGGLLLRRVLQALGAESRLEREALDEASLAVTDLPAGLDLAGAGPTGDDVVIRLRDDATPAALWAAATRYTAAQTQALLTAIDQVVGPHSRAVACGGWTRMASVRAAKSAVIDHLTFSSVSEPGVLGAALLAGQAADPHVTPHRRPAAPPTSTEPVHKELA